VPTIVSPPERVVHDRPTRLSAQDRQALFDIPWLLLGGSSSYRGIRRFVLSFFVCHFPFSWVRKLS
jgi:hypothetical protein